MPQVYVIEKGVRYSDLSIVEMHNTQNGGKNAAATMASGYEEQVPPADGYLVSYLDAAFNFLGVREQEVIDP